MDSSIASSLLALVERSAMRSACWSKCSLTTESRVKAGPAGSKVVPTTSIRLAQWRGCMAGLRKSMISGIVFLNESTLSCTCPRTVFENAIHGVGNLHRMLSACQGDMRLACVQRPVSKIL